MCRAAISPIHSLNMYYPSWNGTLEEHPLPLYMHLQVRLFLAYFYLITFSNRNLARTSPANLANIGIRIPRLTFRILVETKVLTGRSQPLLVVHLQKLERYYQKLRHSVVAKPISLVNLDYTLYNKSPLHPLPSHEGLL